MIPKTATIPIWTHLAPASGTGVASLSRAESLARRTLEQHLARRNDRHARAELTDIVDDVCRQDHDDIAADRREEIEKAIALGRIKAGRDINPDALGFGPRESNWENGLYGGVRGLILALPTLLLVLIRPFRDGLSHHDPLLLLRPFQDMVIAVAQWYAAGFFFGYFFPYLRGESGLKKGLYLSLAVLLCHLPIWIDELASPSARAALLFRVSAIVIFYMGLGVWFFDYRSFRQSLRDRFSWGKFLRFESTPGLTALGSVILGSIAAAVTSVVTGQFQAILGILTRLVTSEPTPPGPR